MEGEHGWVGRQLTELDKVSIFFRDKIEMYKMRMRWEKGLIIIHRSEYEMLFDVTSTSLSADNGITWSKERNPKNMR